MDRGAVQSLVKIADDPAIMGTVDNKKPINVRFWGRGRGSRGSERYVRFINYA